MQIAIANVLNRAELDMVHAALEHAKFADGRETAGWAAKLVKDNMQAAASDHSLDAARRLIADKILNNDLFKLAARPKKLSPLLFSRYEPGMRYGAHVDDALMGGMRSDVAFTLFLSEPGSYDGGELVIESSSGEEGVKLDAGSLFVYPATTLHRVAEVTKAARYVAVGWARSLVRDAAKRELLFDLDTAKRRVFERDGKSAEFDLIAKSSANLLRMWVED
jgi:PKHD-type hydroxylase